MFKVFNRDEKYIGTLKDVIEAKHVEEINGEDALEITTLEQQINNFGGGRNLLLNSNEDVNIQGATWQDFNGLTWEEI